MQQVVNNYGVHTIEGISYLVQDRGELQNGFGTSGELEIAVRTRKTCPHHFDISCPEPTKEFLEAIVEHPLIELMRPSITPKKPAFLVQTDKTLGVIYYLAHMGSPTGILTPTELEDLELTNLGTLTIKSVDYSINNILRDLEQNNRTCVFIGDKMAPVPKGVTKIKSLPKFNDILRDGEQWRRYGNKIVRDLLRS